MLNNYIILDLMPLSSREKNFPVSGVIPARKKLKAFQLRV
jgi:hypothetical protein